MGAAMSVSMSGADGLKKQLAALSEGLREDALRSAAYAGAAIIQKQAIANAPYFTGTVSQGHPPPGTLKNSIVVKRVVEDCGDYKQSYIIAVRRGPKGTTHDAYYAHWVEFGHIYRAAGDKLTGGTAARSAKRAMHISMGGKVVPAHPFMRPAYLSTRDAAMRAIEQRLGQYITFAGA
jgi:HK97 gp10 family phage protein